MVRYGHDHTLQHTHTYTYNDTYTYKDTILYYLLDNFIFFLFSSLFSGIASHVNELSIYFGHTHSTHVTTFLFYFFFILIFFFYSKGDLLWLLLPYSLVRKGETRVESVSIHRDIYYSDSKPILTGYLFAP